MPIFVLYNGSLNKIEAAMGTLSFDYDGTLSGKDVQDYAKEKKSLGYKIVITTARNSTDDNSKLEEVAKEIGISTINYTDGADKWKTLKNKSYKFHLDNNPDQTKLINENTNVTGITKTGNWKSKCDGAL